VTAVSSREIALVRAFNRDYTRRIGVLGEALLDSPYSLTEARVLYEIAHRPEVTARELAADLNLDRGYLSRILKRFTEQRLLLQSASAEDGRRRNLTLTAAGKRGFAELDRRSRQQVADMLSGLDSTRRQAVLEGMQSVQSALAGIGVRATAETDEIVYRTHRPGDMGWVVQRHGELYCQEYGWDETFEALVAQIACEFIRRRDAERERCWIAECRGRRVGCVFLVAADAADAGGASAAKLRLLLVEPAARGLGVGRRLVAECVEFARAARYDRIVLWTQESLAAARHLYSGAGFHRTAVEPHHSFGHDLVAETWERRLR
jgi:DNA-binding MarR family transcriptional regulator/GNAT superfamily N-acetyltransferase